MEKITVEKLIERDARKTARKFFDQAPPYVGTFFPRPVSGVVREVVETIAARCYVEGYNAALRDEGK